MLCKIPQTECAPRRHIVYERDTLGSLKSCQLRIVSLKNMFVNPDVYHFRRLILAVNVDMGEKRNHICEVVLHVSAIYDFKHRATALMRDPFEYFQNLLPRSSSC